jgi:hypothetical protein
MFNPRLEITNAITNALTRIERARGFLEAHHTTHIEGTHLTLAQAEKLWAGKSVHGFGATEHILYNFGHRLP